MTRRTAVSFALSAPYLSASKLRWVSLSWAALALFSLGCASIVGADDYSVSAAGSENTAGAGGSAMGGSAGASGASGGSVQTDGGAGTDHVNDASVMDHDLDDAPKISRDAIASSDAPEDIVTSDRIIAGAGENVCSSTCTGAGLSCLETAFGTNGLCTYQCDDSSQCDAGHTCFGLSDPSDMFPNSCVKLCSPGTCPSGFGCFPADTTRSICLPLDWLEGVGDDCTADGQCTSQRCRNAPAGWCTVSCGPGNAECAHDPNSDYNYYNQFNWCVLNADGYWCMPGCTVDTDCAPYPNTTCKNITDADGLDGTACIP